MDEASHVVDALWPLLKRTPFVAPAQASRGRWLIRAARPAQDKSWPESAYGGVPPWRRVGAAWAGRCPGDPRAAGSRDTGPAHGSSGGLDGLEDDAGHDRRL